MNQRNANNTDDLLDRATAALRDVAVSDGPPPQLQADVLSALRDDRRAATSNRRRLTMNSIVKLAIAATIAIVIGGVLWVAPPWGGQVAFGDVLKKVNGSKSVRFKAKTVVSIPNGPKQTVDSTIAISGNRMRQELPGSVQLLDFDKGEMLMLTETAKQAVRMKMTNVPPQVRATNLLEQFRTLTPDQAKDLGVKEVDGRKLHAFAVDNPAQSMTVYVDPQTRQPVRIEAKLNLPSVPPSESVMSDFDWDAQPAPAEFVLDVPPGYSEQTMTLDMTPPTERTLIEGLETAAKMNGGTFPDSFDLTAATNALAQRFKGKTPEEMKAVQAEMMPEVMKISRGISFMMPNNGGDFRYAGKGAKLGEAGRPVLWYQPKESATYRVIHADLSVHAVAPDALPKIESSKLPGESAMQSLMKPAATQPASPPTPAPH